MKINTEDRDGCVSWLLVALVVLAVFLFLSATRSDAQTAEQASRWNHARVNSRRLVELDKAVALYQRLAPRYQRLEAMRANGVPAVVIFGLHYREASNSFASSLAQGDPLTHRSIHVPRGRIPGKNPPYTWEEAAADALYAPELDHMDAKDWKSLGAVLQNIESYNGLGYQRRGIISPYLWSGTDLYKRGKYTGDGRYDPRAVDSQLGCAAILLRMKERGIALPF